MYNVLGVDKVLSYEAVEMSRPRQSYELGL